MKSLLYRPIRLIARLALPVTPLTACAQTSQAIEPAPSMTATTDDDEADVEADRLEWFREARFGMFIHWGPVALTGHEIGWSRGTQTPQDQYDRLYTRFNPEEFNADAWAQIAADAGMKYLVITAKHHDGFCLWDSELTDYDIMDTPFGRDVVAELAEACEERGVRFCVYYSIADWYDANYTPQNMTYGGPGYALPAGVEPDMDQYVAYMKGQLEEIITRHNPGLIWFDGEWERPWSVERGRDLWAYLMDLDSDLIVNNRVGQGRTTQQDANNLGDYDTPEQKIGAFQNERMWETCMTICNQWAWKPNDPMKSFSQCIQTLVTTACGDGNLLFNVGPTAEGVIEERQAARLREMGAWLETYGDTIYSTRGGPWRPGQWGGSTHRGNEIYLHILGYPENGLTLPAYGQRITAASLFHDGTEVAWSQDEGGTLTITLPEEAVDAVDTVVTLTVAEPVDRLAEPGRALSIFHSDARYGEVISRDAELSFSSVSDHGNPDHHPHLLDGDATVDVDFTFHTDEEQNPWVVIDLGETRTVTGMSIVNRPGFEGRAEALSAAISVDGETWEPVWRAEQVKAHWDVSVTRPEAGIETPGRPARYVRLRVASDDPTYLHLRSVEIWGR